MTFLMAQGLKHCKTRVLEGSIREFGGEGGAGSGDFVKQSCGTQKWGFTQVLAEDVSRGNSTSGYSIRRLEVLNPPRRILRAPASAAELLGLDDSMIR